MRELCLQALNRTDIATYKVLRSLSLDLSLWVFIIADVQQPILGAYFLRHFGLAVDLRCGKLLDTTTQLQVNSTMTPSLPSSLGIMHPTSIDKSSCRVPVHHTDLIQQPASQAQGDTPHQDYYPSCVWTHAMARSGTSLDHTAGIGPYVGPWDHQTLLQQLVIPVPKKTEGDWRQCDDYRALNTTPPCQTATPFHTCKTSWRHCWVSSFSLTWIWYAHTTRSPWNRKTKTAITTPFGLFKFKPNALWVEKRRPDLSAVHR